MDRFRIIHPQDNSIRSFLVSVALAGSFALLAVFCLTGFALTDVAHRICLGAMGLGALAHLFIFQGLQPRFCAALDGAYVYTPLFGVGLLIWAHVSPHFYPWHVLKVASAPILFIGLVWATRAHGILQLGLRHDLRRVVEEED